ncbi:MAG TPA: hypothetical protein PLL57_09850 [Flavobacteriales bacterium]|nr:hypothetical protein [Flavobacteriales bacterium]
MRHGSFLVPATRLGLLVLFREEVPFVLPSSEKRAAIRAKDRPSSTENLFLRAYPNPAKGPVHLVYEVAEGVAAVQLRVFDAQGRLVLDRALAPKNGIVELDKLQSGNGLHVATLFWDGIQVASLKLQLLR